ncbi:uncharacterized protein BDR25DRAFT_318538 [Lindgomyces ingoldianus]|uniref:Uncharacterized protein n=1 Tax=Lindgomyces ingoldianus TaxID=673940 RepID=A0ACB6QEK1_9PLEO|nr:uncharacterized protein BDR25DRAFT_318538 [Lindgomyces ingoldianus]KAF2465285.1 hypothetical protein BDR25DRAFT_318538 [Lindgomyces ingoldianus]
MSFRPRGEDCAALAIPTFVEDDLISFVSFEANSPPAASMKPSSPRPTLPIDLLDEDTSERQGPTSPHQFSKQPDHLSSYTPDPRAESKKMGVTSKPRAETKDSFADALRMLANGNPFSPRGIDTAQASRVKEPVVLAKVMSIDSYIGSPQPVTPLQKSSQHEWLEPAYDHHAITQPPAANPSLAPTIMNQPAERPLIPNEELLHDMILQLQDLVGENEHRDSALTNFKSLSPPRRHIQPPPGLGLNQGVEIVDDGYIQQSSSSRSVQMFQPNEYDARPIVRLTLPAYNSMVENEIKIKDDMAKADRRHRDELYRLQSELDHLNSQVLRHQSNPQPSQTGSASAVLEKKDDMIRELNGRLAAALMSERLVDSLTVELERLRSSQNATINAHQDEKGVLIARKDQEISGLKARLMTSEQNEKSVKALVAERDALLTKLSAAPNASQQQENITKLAKQEKEILNLYAKIATEENKNNHLSNQLKKMSKVPAATKHIAELEEKLKHKTAEANRLRNDLREANRVIEVKQATCEKFSQGGKVLRGAAHLVKTSPNTKLPKTVFSCVECYVKSLTCDSSPTCRNCVENGEKCFRWRCSLSGELRSLTGGFPSGKAREFAIVDGRG